MASGSSVLILGIFMASAIAQDITKSFNSQMSNSNSTATEMYLRSTIPFSTTFINLMSSSISSTPSTTQTKGQETTRKAEVITTPRPSTSPKPLTPVPTSLPTQNKRATTVKPETSRSGGNTGIIIIIVLMIIAAIVFVLVCYFARKRGRRYSVDFASRPDEANIPLSAIEPEVPAGAAPQNGLQTFENADTTTKAAEESEAAPVAKEEEKAEADKSAAEAAVPPSPADGPGDAGEEDNLDKTHAPAEENLGEKTDDEGMVSNKTSVESLKESDGNNAVKD
ncbi:uncharacterized protein si:dkey-27h10.2 [Thalassophryne amazonica]|uniref:uncharacterized protein si:dkey-27h10.2 n=1 Tax=Thalassophryne amazonica TaxID=390379 RepID=UPI0014717CA2|nr:uncharacterized protein si:dkey-27h10.2 [Thalassophryne amazonica]